jgi:16S rRNA (guanine527-N7)-methyltransferase
MLSRAKAENFLAQGLKNMGLVLEDQPEALARLSLYFQELNKWNKKVNLVARSLDHQQILENHFLDSLTLLELLRLKMRKVETVLDIGTGAGFPGLVLKAACPALSVTLVEPLKKRYYFLKHIIRTLDLTGVEVLNVYLEGKYEVEKLPAQYFSFITSRAFTDISRFIKLGSPYLREGGIIVMMKGPGLAEELGKLASGGLPEQFRLAEKRKILLPYSKKERWLVSFSRSG